jgi:hypothetical protein
MRRQENNNIDENAETCSLSEELRMNLLRESPDLFIPSNFTNKDPIDLVINLN